MKTRKDYQDAANLINVMAEQKQITSCSDAREFLIGWFSADFNQYSNFDKDRFLKAIGKLK